MIDTQKRFLTTMLLKAIPTKIFISSSANYFLSDFVPSNRGEKNLTKQLINLANVYHKTNRSDIALIKLKEPIPSIQTADSVTILDNEER